jgi:sulfur-oxidizing protein SoxZ
MSDIKVRAKIEGGETVVKCLINHPMETGLRKDSKTNELVPAHFINEVICKWKDQTVMSCEWGSGVSKNPYLSFKFKGGAAGDPVEVSWTDNKGESQSEKSEIS